MSDREKVAQWMISRGYATGHGDTVEDLLKELEWQLAENWTNSVMEVAAAEREACAKVAEARRFLAVHEDSMVARFGRDCAAAIRARGEK